jgi:hypothetical protein
MSFYLLKSTFDRENVGDLLINKNEIETMTLIKKQFKDRVNPVYCVRIFMKSRDHDKAMFNTLEEAKNFIKDILGDKIDDTSLNEWMAYNPS